MSLIQSTLGFVFTPDYQQVLLIRKDKPAFHKNKLNGLGGKCEGNETAQECIRREVIEEAGIEIPANSWRTITTLTWKEWYVDVFAAIYSGKIDISLPEDVKWYPVRNLPDNIITNLMWLIPLCVDIFTNPHPPVVKEVTYPEE
jgi:8-oxo-dGTP diphosphatase